MRFQRLQGSLGTEDATREILTCCWDFIRGRSRSPPDRLASDEGRGQTVARCQPHRRKALMTLATPIPKDVFISSGSDPSSLAVRRPWKRPVDLLPFAPPHSNVLLSNTGGWLCIAFFSPVGRCDRHSRLCYAANLRVSRSADDGICGAYDLNPKAFEWQATTHTGVSVDDRNLGEIVSLGENRNRNKAVRTG